MVSVVADRSSALAVEHAPSSDLGRFPRYDEYDNKWRLSPSNSGGTSLTTRMPNESGPKASWRASNGTVPGFR